MKKIIIFILIIILLGVIWFIFFSKPANHQDGVEDMAQVENKKVAIVIAFRNFRDEEYFVPKEELEKAEITVTTASNQMGTARGVDGGEANVDILLSELKVADYDGIVFVGGPGCLESLDNQASYQLIQETVKQDKILAAICISPVVLAKAGVLSGKKATVWTSALDKDAVKTLKDNNVDYQEDSVVVDGKIITADGPSAAEEFSQAIINALGS